MDRLLVMRCGLGLLGLAGLLIGAPSAAPAARPSVVTLLTVRGSIDGFAQDGNRIAWVNSFEPCKRSMHIRVLSTRRTTALPACSEGGIQHRMALAGTRVLWADVNSSTSSFIYFVHTVAAGDRKQRVLDTVERTGGFEKPDTFKPIPVAGDGGTLAYAQISNRAESVGYAGAFKVSRARHYVVGTTGTVALATSGGRLALSRPIAPGCACNYRPSWSPDGRRILFVGTLGAARDRREVYSMNADGSDLRRLSSTGGRASSASWSPDGRYLLYTRVGPYSEDDRVMLASGDGTIRRVLGTGSAAEWSPDGQWVAFTTSRGKLFVVSARGGRPRSLGNGSEFTWSPDSRSVAVTRDGDLAVVDVATGSARRIVRDPSGYVGFISNPKWSPDGSRIAFRQYDPRDSKGWLHVVRPDGSGDVRLAEADYGIAWSPDSELIAYTRGYVGSVTVISSAGGQARELAAGADAEWSPDGRELVYAAPRDGENREIARISVDGTAPRVLTSSSLAAGRNAVEIRDRRGRIVSTFTTPVVADGVALSGSRVAVLLNEAGRSRIEVRTLTGRVVRSVRVRRPTTDEIAMSGRWVVFRTRRVMIHALDVRTGRQRFLARAKGTPVGLSIEGRRVAWAEQGSSKGSSVPKSTIRAIILR